MPEGGGRGRLVLRWPGWSWGGAAPSQLGCGMVSAVNNQPPDLKPIGALLVLLVSTASALSRAMVDAGARPALAGVAARRPQHP